MRCLFYILLQTQLSSDKLTRKMTLTGLLVLLMVTSFSLQQKCEDPRDSPEKRLRAVRDLEWLDDQWVLAFRLSSGIKMAAYDDYIDTTRDDDHPIARAFLPDPCLEPHCGHCKQHYHSSLLNVWPSRYIDQVRVAVIKDGQEVAYILFNGTGSTAVSWFSPKHVISSSWSDMTSNEANYLFFSIDGHYDANRRPRRFFVVKNYGGCQGDRGWLCVQDLDTDICAWGKVNASHPYPAILYSKKETFVRFYGADMGRADTLTVAVKFLGLNITDWRTC